MYLSNWLFVFVKMFVCFCQSVCLFTWKRWSALPAAEVLHQARLVLLVAQPENSMHCLSVGRLSVCLFFSCLSDITCFAFGGRPRPFGLAKDIASPIFVVIFSPSGWLLAIGGLPHPLGTLDKGKVDPSSSPDVVVCSEQPSLTSPTSKLDG